MLTIGIVLDGFSSLSGIIYAGIGSTLAFPASGRDSFIFVGEGNRRGNREKKKNPLHLPYKGPKIDTEMRVSLASQLLGRAS
jgi:hypothetical protein